MKVRSTTWVALLITVGLVLLAYLVIEPIVAQSRMFWPEIVSPSALLGEARWLCATHTNYFEIPEDKWPPNIKLLRPRNAAVSYNYLTLVISGGGINAGWGYAVYPDGRTNMPKNVLGMETNSIHPGIFRITHIE